MSPAQRIADRLLRKQADAVSPMDASVVFTDDPAQMALNRERARAARAPADPFAENRAAARAQAAEQATQLEAFRAREAARTAAPPAAAPAAAPAAQPADAYEAMRAHAKATATPTREGYGEIRPLPPEPKGPSAMSRVKEIGARALERGKEIGSKALGHADDAAAVVNRNGRRAADAVGRGLYATEEAVRAGASRAAAVVNRNGRRAADAVGRGLNATEEAVRAGASRAAPVVKRVGKAIWSGNGRGDAGPLALGALGVGLGAYAFGRRKKHKKEASQSPGGTVTYTGMKFAAYDNGSANALATLGLSGLHPAMLEKIAAGLIDPNTGLPLGQAQAPVGQLVGADGNPIASAPAPTSRILAPNAPPPATGPAPQLLAPNGQPINGPAPQILAPNGQPARAAPQILDAQGAVIDPNKPLSTLLSPRGEPITHAEMQLSAQNSARSGARQARMYEYEHAARNQRLAARRAAVQQDPQTAELIKLRMKQLVRNQANVGSAGLRNYIVSENSANAARAAQHAAEIEALKAQHAEAQTKGMFAPGWKRNTTLALGGLGALGLGYGINRLMNRDDQQEQEY